MATDVHAVARDRLRTTGQRYTPTRRSLVDVLERSDRPLTIPEILKRKRGLAQSSVYRNLGLLEQAGVVCRIITTDDHARYELTEDLTEHHHHLICAECGRVDDFTVAPQVERALHGAIDRVSEDTGFTAVHHRLDLIGTCEGCASA